MSHSKFLFVARGVSLSSDYSRQKLGCVIVYKNNIQSFAHNSEKTHTMQMKYSKYRKLHGDKIIHKVHAEIAALSKVRYLDIDWSKAVVYIYRELKNGTKALARPCPSCMAAIKERGIKKIVYTTEDGYAIEKISN